MPLVILLQRGMPLLVILSSLALMFVLFSLRDVVGDLQFIFERRLLRQLRTFSLRRLLVLTSIVACYFGLLRLANGGWENAFLFALAVGFVTATAWLSGIAYQDITAKAVRRRYREEFLPGESRSGPPHFEMREEDSSSDA